jgi:hypothetical protein
MSDLTPELAALVDTHVITHAQAQEAMAATPGEDEFDGYARCMQPQCDEHETDRPLRLRREYKETWAEDLPIVLGRTEYITVVDDSELSCPTCGFACAVLVSKPPSYQRLAPA